MTPILFEGQGGLALAGTAFGNEADPPVLLLAPGGQTKEVWYEVAEALADAGRWAVCLDLRGHGDSARPMDGRYDLDAYAADIRAVCAWMRRRPAIVGSAVAGAAALVAIGEDEVPFASALILVGAGPWQDAERARRVARELLDQALGFASEAEARAAVARLRPDEHLPETIGISRLGLERREDGRVYWRFDPAFLRGFDPGRETERLAAAAARIRIPVLQIRGEAHTVVTDAMAQRFQDLVSTAELQTVERAGYHVAAERLDAFNAILLEFLERRAPRVPVTFEEGADPRVLRDALGCFGTGVTVVTAMAPNGTPIGFTANSFSSVSLDPPLILFCMANNSQNLSAFASAPSFAINVLHIGQQPAAAQFASRSGERFSAVAWERWSDGPPILAGSLASFDCVREAVHDAGDHKIFVGRVRRASFAGERDPLLFFRGRYRRLHFA